MSQVRAPSLLQPSPELLAVQKLMPIGKDDRERLKASIEKNGVKDPIKVYSKAGKYYILSGLNRWQIACELGLELVPIETIDNVRPRERHAFAIDENLSRRQLTRQQKQALIDHLLTGDPQASSRSIAKKIGVDKNTVETARQKDHVVKFTTWGDRKAGAGVTTAETHRQNSRGEIHHVKRKGADGKTYKVSQKGKKSGGEFPHLKKQKSRVQIGHVKQTKTDQGRQRAQIREAFSAAIEQYGQGLSRSEIQKELEAALQMKEARLQTD